MIIKAHCFLRIQSKFDTEINNSSRGECAADVCAIEACSASFASAQLASLEAILAR